MVRRMVRVLIAFSMGLFIKVSFKMIVSAVSVSFILAMVTAIMDL
jgi:hypothetical protein